MNRLLKLFVFVAALSLWSVANATNVILVSADGRTEQTELSTLQNIAVVQDTINKDNALMTANFRDGTMRHGLRTVVIGERKMENDAKVEGVVANSDAIAVYPNPVSNNLYISGAGDDPKVRILNMSGAVVMQNVGTEIEVSSLPSGMYIVCVGGRYAKFIKK